MDKATWYVYDGRDISGPFFIDYVLNLHARSESKDNLFISQRGMKNWHTIDEAVRLFDIINAPQKVVKEEKKNFETLVSNEMYKLGKIQRQTERAIDNAKSVQTLQKVYPTEISTEIRHSSSVEEFLTQQTVSLVSHEKNEEQTLAQETNKVDSDLVEIQKFNVKPRTFKKSAIVPPLTPEMSYLIARGRLRLGEVRSLFLSSFIKPVLSLSLYWPFWVNAVYKEISWHMFNARVRGSFFITVASMIPVIHVLAISKLASKISKLEMQNGYQRTSTAFAMLLAVFPPFAMWYLQGSVNYHWKLHVNYFLQSQRRRG